MDGHYSGNFLATHIFIEPEFDGLSLVSGQTLQCLQNFKASFRCLFHFYLLKLQGQNDDILVFVVVMIIEALSSDTIEHGEL